MRIAAQLLAVARVSSKPRLAVHPPGIGSFALSAADTPSGPIRARAAVTSRLATNPGLLADTSTVVNRGADAMDDPTTWR